MLKINKSYLIDGMGIREEVVCGGNIPFDDQPDNMSGKGPLRIIVGLLLVLILLVAILPYSSVRLDPEPKVFAGTDVIPEGLSEFEKVEIKDRYDFLKLIDPDDPIIKNVADKIATTGCDSNNICQSKAIFYFVRDNVNYVSDPVGYEYVKDWRETLSTMGGDCDDQSVLLSNMLQAIGIRTRFVFISGHVYIQIYLPEALKKYKVNGGDWINLDPTCSYCGFGEIPLENVNEDKIYVG